MHQWEHQEHLVRGARSRRAVRAGGGERGDGGIDGTEVRHGATADGEQDVAVGQNLPRVAARHAALDAQHLRMHSAHFSLKGDPARSDL